MKLSKKPTGLILIKAHVQSEWDSCDYCIWSISNKMIPIYKTRLQSTSLLKNDSSFYCSEYWESPDEWIIEDELSDHIYEVISKEGWCYLVEDSLKEEYRNPEQTVDTETMMVESNGDIFFKGYGKHTSEEFWTDSIPLGKILNELQDV